MSWFGKGKTCCWIGYWIYKIEAKHAVVVTFVRLCFTTLHNVNVCHNAGSCLLQFSRSMVQLCECPMCQPWIYNLAPHSPLLIQPGREEQVGEILTEIQQYNRDNKVGWLFKMLLFTPSYK